MTQQQEHYSNDTLTDLPPTLKRVNLLQKVVTKDNPSNYSTTTSK